MKRFFIYITIGLLSISCITIDNKNPYEKTTQTLSIEVSFPEGFSSLSKAGLTVNVSDILSGSAFSGQTDASGKVSFSVINGLYRVATSYTSNEDIFNASKDRIRITGEDKSIKLNYIHARLGPLVIKEIYCGGCKKAPIEGEYQVDKYFIIHNNSENVEYLDKLCFGTVSPYNSTAVNPWYYRDDEGQLVLPDFCPIIQCVWAFGGEGTDFPLNPGEDAVVAITGAIDHSATYPLSVNLNHEDYFVCYSEVHFPNTHYHPAPGDKIRPERILNVVIKTGIANAYTFSISSPTLVLFRPEGTTIEEFVSIGENVIPVPGSSSDRVVCVPEDWVLDGVEVFDEKSARNTKRLTNKIDAGNAFLSAIYEGKTLMRKVDEAKSASRGYEVLMDTNNSLNDFYESDTQSLWK